MLDPTNTIFRSKEICFFLLIMLYFFVKHKYNYNKIDRRTTTVLIILFFINTFSLVFGEFMNFKFDYSITLDSFKTFVFFAVLYFVRDVKIESLVDKIIIPSVLVSLITISIFSFLFLLPISAIEIIPYDLTFNHTMMIGGKEILGININQVFYKTSPILVLTFSIVFSRALNVLDKRKKNLLFSLLIFVAIIMSGTRANLFSALLILIALSLFKMSKSNMGRVAVYPLLLVFIIFSFIMTTKLLKQKDDYSIEVKSGHIESMKLLVKEHPLILIFGQGPGSFYYSSGIKKEITLSELSYLEIIRNYGIISGSFIIILFLFPFYIIRKNRIKNSFPFIIGYIAYLFIGGTNPLLLSSTGILVLAVAYSYAYNQNLVKSEKNSNIISSL